MKGKILQLWPIYTALVLSSALYIWQGMLPRTSFFTLLFSWAAIGCFAVILYRQLRTASPTLWWWVGMLLRLSVLFYLPNLSDDYLRYLFDGKLTTIGMNPFLHLPATQLEIVNGTVEQHLLIAAKNYYSVYPPLPQLCFAFAWWIGQSVVGAVLALKLCWLVFEGLTIWLLPKALLRWKLPPANALFYILHPLVIIELIGNLHIEVGMTLGLTLALYAWTKPKLGLYGAGLGWAVGFKLLPLLFIPSLLFQKRAHRSWAIVFMCMLAIVPFLLFDPLQSLPNIGSSLQLYVNHFAFNGGLFTLLVSGLPTDHKNVAQILAFTFLCGFCILSWRHWRKRLNVPHYWLGILVIYYTMATTVNPWYIVPIVMLATFSQWTFPIVWGGAVLLSYSAFQVVDMQVPAIFLVLEYVLLLLAILLDLYRHGILSSMAGITTRQGKG